MTEKKKTRRMPFFLSMGSCPRRCVYCDQREITGKRTILSPGEVGERVSLLDGPHEICFFGGSFTCFPLPRQKEYLECIHAAPSGSTLRFSTHPGCISPAGLDFLSPYPVSIIELGVSSLDDAGLRNSNRGYTGGQALAAMKLVLEKGFGLCAQMMIGLPGQSEASSLEDLDRIAAMAPRAGTVFLRIYPCLVLKGTTLADLLRAGAYSPLSADQGARWAGKMLLKARSLGFSVLRVGLQETESLSSSVMDGPHHPALGELARAACLAFSLASRSASAPPLTEKDALLMKAHGKYGLRLLAELTGKNKDELEDKLSLSHFSEREVDGSGSSE